MLAFNWIALAIQAVYTSITSGGVAFYDPRPNGGSMLDNGTALYSSRIPRILTLPTQLAVEAESL